MAETTWDYTLKDYSPLFLYLSGLGEGSRRVGNLDSAWNQSCPYEPAGPLNNFLCDVSSVHTTRKNGATISLDFHGQGVQIIGNVTGALQFDVNVDGAVTRGTPTGQLLASVSGLPQGDHNISLTVTEVGSGSNLLIESAIVTVGTGLTGANVIRTIVQDSDSLVRYGAGWTQPTFDVWNITHSPNNGSWHQLNFGTASQATFSFTGTAVMTYGFSWSFFPTRYRLSVDGGPTVNYASSSTLQSSTTGRVYSNGLLHVQTDLDSSQHTLTFDNDDGVGQIGLDYLEIISVTGGVPITSARSSSTGIVSPNPTRQPTSATESALASASTSQSRSTSVGVIVGPIVGVVAAILLVLAIFLWRRKRNHRLAGSSITPFHDIDDSMHTPSVLPNGKRAVPPVFMRGATPTTMPVSGLNAFSPSSGKHRMHARNGTAVTTSSSVGDVPMASVSSDASAPVIQAMQRDIQQLMRLVARPRTQADESPPDYAR